MLEVTLYVQAITQIGTARVQLQIFRLRCAALKMTVVREEMRVGDDGGAMRF
jgi:hypothetical protein